MEAANFTITSSAANWWSMIEMEEKTTVDEGYVSELKPPEVPVNLTSEELPVDPQYTQTTGPPCYPAWSPYSRGGIPSPSSTRLPATTYLHNRLDAGTPAVKPPADYVVPMSRYRPPLLVDAPPKDNFEKTMDLVLTRSFQEVYRAGMAPLRSRFGAAAVPIHSLFPREEERRQRPVDLRDLTPNDLYGRVEEDTSFWEQESTCSDASMRPEYQPGFAQRKRYFPAPAVVENEPAEYFPKPKAALRLEERKEASGEDRAQREREMNAFMDSLNKGAIPRTSTPLPREPAHLHLAIDEQRNDEMLDLLRDLLRTDSERAPVKMTVKSVRSFDLDPATDRQTFTAPLDEVSSIGSVRVSATVTNRRPASSPGVRNSPLCKFCLKNGEPAEVYATHTTKGSDGSVTCPILMKYVCDICGATGATSHTRSYCPKNPEGPGMRRGALGYRRLSNGVLTSCFNHK